MSSDINESIEATAHPNRCINSHRAPNFETDVLDGSESELGGDNRGMRIVQGEDGKVMDLSEGPQPIVVPQIESLASDSDDGYFEEDGNYNEYDAAFEPEDNIRSECYADGDGEKEQRWRFLRIGQFADVVLDFEEGTSVDDMLLLKAKKEVNAIAERIKDAVGEECNDRVTLDSMFQLFFPLSQLEKLRIITCSY